jgi:hypothetical protein
VILQVQSRREPKVLVASGCSGTADPLRRWAGNCARCRVSGTARKATELQNPALWHRVHGMRLNFFSVIGVGEMDER